MILYTTTAGGWLYELPFKTSHQKIMKQLYKHRIATNPGAKGRSAPSFLSHLTQPGRKPSLVVHSVFFLKKNGILKKGRVWDATLNGYRDQKIPGWAAYMSKQSDNVRWDPEQAQMYVPPGSLNYIKRGGPLDVKR